MKSITLFLEQLKKYYSHLGARPLSQFPSPNGYSIFLSALILAALPLGVVAQTNEANEAKPASRPRDTHPLLKPADPALPTLFLIGDSTVRNGNGNGAGSQWGWGDFLAPFFQTNRLNVVNEALGGTSSRTYYRDRWPGVLAMMKPGDLVIMQFGHNDSSPPSDATRARGTIKGVGDETQEIDNPVTHRHEVVHSFGWYEKQIISEARAQGVTPMVCSLIPRNTWRDGRAARNKNDYAGWAGEAARSENAPFLDINEIIARQYDQLGQERVKALFIAGAGPHTSLAGAETNAACVIAALKGLKENPLDKFFSEKATAVPPADLEKPAPAPAKAAHDMVTPENF